MKAFLLGLILLVGITAVSAIVMDQADWSAANIYSGDRGNVRL